MAQQLNGKTTPRSKRANSNSATIVTRRFRNALARRKAVAELRLKGIVSQADIARELGVNRSLICKDFKVLDEQFRTEAAQDTMAHKALDLRRIEDIIGTLWDKRKDSRTARVILQYLERKAAMLGLDAPKQVDLVDWRREASRMGLDPEQLFQDMVQYVGARVGAMPSPPLLDLEPSRPYSFPNGQSPHHYDDGPNLRESRLDYPGEDEEGTVR